MVVALAGEKKGFAGLSTCGPRHPITDALEAWRCRRSERTGSIGWIRSRPPAPSPPSARSPLPEPEFPHYPLAMVEWHDAWFDLDLESPDGCRQDYLVHTVGFLVSEGPRFVSLAQEILPDGEGLRAVTHIPLAIVERVIRLERSAESFDRPASTHLASG